LIDNNAMHYGVLYRSSAVLGAGPELPPAQRPEDPAPQHGFLYFPTAFQTSALVCGAAPRWTGMYCSKSRFIFSSAGCSALM